MRAWVMMSLIACRAASLLMEFVWDLVNVSNKANIIIVVHD